MNAYDAFASLYDRYWAHPMQQWQMPALERLLLADLPPNAAVLDLCCGTGHLARELVRCGFSVTGIDNSSGMLNIARTNVPENAEFFLQNASTFQLSNKVDAAVCTFDSVNHILHPKELLASFLQVRKSLKPGSPFLFDANTREAYGEHWDSSATVVEPDHAFFLRGHFDPQTNRGTTEITIFHLEEHWLRTDVQLQQRSWEPSELASFLTEAGFENIECLHAQADLGLSGHYGQGRIYVRSVVPKP